MGDGQDATDDVPPRIKVTTDPEVGRSAAQLLGPWRRMTSPLFFDLDRVPEQGPALLVGNHTMWGMFDVPLLYAELLEKRGIFLRPLGDHAHFKVPVWREIIQVCGVVDGNRENFARLMAEQSHVLVFPGGAREVMKRRDEIYRLVWGNRIGFAKMALRHACPIVPFAAVGMDDAFRILVDPEELMATWLGKGLRRLGLRRDLAPPITTPGVPNRIYFAIGETLDPADYSEGSEEERAWALRRATAAVIEERLSFLLEQRRRDPRRGFGTRVLAALERRLDGAEP